MNQRVRLTPEQLKQLQKKSLEMAKYIVDFCKEHNIKCMFYAGALLGAVRHHGFIPWDDDIDIVLTPPEFDKFIDAWDKYADKERYSLCLQSKTYNDHTLSGSIRDNNTTFITDSTVDLDVNQGVAIDFGQFTVCPKSRIAQHLQVVLGAGQALFMAGRVPARQKPIVKTAARIILGIFRSPKIQYVIWSSLARIVNSWNKNYDKCEYLREITMFPFIRWMFPKEWFDDIVWVPFEDIEVPIPVGAKEYLTKRYGNYMELPPEKDRHPEHRIVFMDLDTPYKEYRGKKYFVGGKE